MKHQIQRLEEIYQAEEMVQIRPRANQFRSKYKKMSSQVQEEPQSFNNQKRKTTKPNQTDQKLKVFDLTNINTHPYNAMDGPSMMENKSPILGPLIPNSSAPLDLKERNVFLDDVNSKGFGAARVDPNTLIGNPLSNNHREQEKHSGRPYTNHQEFLESITTTIDCQKDLNLYELDKSISTEKFSLVGIKILGLPLQQAYGNKKYIIRCFSSKEKIFELALDEIPYHIDANRTTFAYIFKNQVRSVFIMDLISRVSKQTGNQFTEPFELKHELFDNIENIVSFKIGIFKDNMQKIVFVTHQSLYIMPFSPKIDDLKNKPNQFERHTKKIAQSDMNFVQVKDDDDEDEEKYDNDDEDEEHYSNLDDEDEETKNIESKNKKSREIFEQQTSLIMSHDGNRSTKHIRDNSSEDEDYEPYNPAGVEIDRILDFGVNYQFQEGSKYDSKPNELLLLQDSQKRILIMQGRSFGTQYRLIEMIEMKHAKKGNTRLVFQIIDAIMVSSHKIMFLLKIYKYVNPNPSENKPPSRQQIKEMNNQKRIFYKFQMWELFQDKSRKPTTFDVKEDFINEVQLNWRQNVVLDIKNNEFYIQDFKSKDSLANPQVFKMMINNNFLGQVDSFSMKIEHVKDFVGQNISIKEAKEMHHLNGLLYKDFLLFESLLYLAHGRFITIVDINDHKNLKNHYHLCLDTKLHQKPVKFGQSMMTKEVPPQNYDFSNDVAAILMLDKEDLSEMSSRWTILALFKDGTVCEIQEEQNHSSSLNTIQTVRDKFSDRIIPKQRKFHLDSSYLINDKMQQTKIPGRLIKIINNRTSTATLPFFVVEDKGEILLCTIEPRKQLLKKFKFNQLTINSHFFIMNSQAQNHEDIMIIQSKDPDKQSSEIDQQFRHYRLLNKKIESKKDIKHRLLKNDDLPKELLPIDSIVTYFCQQNVTYFVFPKIIQSFSLSTNQSETVILNDNIQQLEVFDDNYIYWRQFDRNEFYLPLQSRVCFDAVDDLQELRSRAQRKEYQLFHTQKFFFPHLQQIYNDRVGEQIGTFFDYHQIKIFPYLHSNRIKLKNSDKNNQPIEFDLEGYKQKKEQKTSEKHEKSIFPPIQNQYLHKIQEEDNMFDEIQEKENVESEQLSSSDSDDQDEYDIYGMKSESMAYQSANNRSFKARKKSRKQKKQKNSEINNFGLDTQNISGLKMAEYVIIQILQNSSNESQADESTTINDYEKYKNVNSLNQIRIKVSNFLLQRHLQNLQTYYYNFEESKDSSYDLLKLISKQNPNVILSVHSMDFKYYLKYNLNEELEVTPFDYNTNPEKYSKEEIDQLFVINSRIRTLYNASMKEREPSFLSKNEIVFMSNDDILLVYKIFEDERGTQNQMKEVLNVAQCQFPGSTNFIPLDTFFMVDESQLIGQNSLIYEKEPHPRNPKRTLERVAPNYFNHFFMQPACSQQDMDDANEMKYLQIHFKQKIELVYRMYQGYIFTSKDFIDNRSYQTDIHIVNTYNFYQWRALNLIKNQRLIVNDISKKQLQNLSFTQLPNGKTLMHMIKRNQESIKALYSQVYDKNVDLIPFHVPILEDKRGNNVLMTLFRVIPKENDEHKEKQFNDMDNVRDQVAMEILKRIADYPYDLFKINMSRVMFELMNIDMVQFAQYMDARNKVPSIITQVQMAKVKSDYVSIMTSDNLWCIEPYKVKEAIENPTYELRRVELMLLDVPHIHLSKNVVKNRYNINLIYEKLAETDNVTVFSYQSVKALIELKWNYIKYRIFYFMLIPYLLLLVFFVFYTCFDLMIFDKYAHNGREMASKALRTLVLLMVSYFAILEGRQLVIAGWAYFYNGWNYMDIAIICLIYVAEIMQGNTIDHNVTKSEIEAHQNQQKTIRTIMSVVAILLWLRLLYFFRIFRTTGYYIRMLVEVIKDIKYFIFIFALTIVSFGHAWSIYLRNGTEYSDTETISHSMGFVYRLALGDFSIIDEFGDYHIEISWIFFILSSLILQIVLINLLISIVSDTFGRIKDNYNVIMYKDMLHMIIENRFLAIGALEKQLQKKYLFIGVPINHEDDATRHFERRLDDIELILREQLRKQIDIQKRTGGIAKVEEKENAIIERLDKMEERQKQILDLLQGKLTQGNINTIASKQ
eukprot:403368887